MSIMKGTPDDILKKIKDDTDKQSRGRLKIFFGYAAGVGKTYAMLKAAHAVRRQGIDVVVGYIEPHTRPQTMQLLNGLERLDTMKLCHKGIELKEFDLDAALKRKPKLILVDELAHTNVEGSRHIKRYQDVTELLKAGIDVYTTINVQHIESLCDIVASITGITVRERIPDKVFDDADQVELVDIEPADLINRLTQGKIYNEVQAEKALDNFFSEKNLIALREIALRRAADRVNRLLEKARQTSEDGYYTDEHILVCLSSSPSNAKIIRTAARLSAAFKGMFTALFVETSNFQSMSNENKERLRRNANLAEQLGAKIETAFGDDVAFQIAEFAKYSGVSKIVLGRSNTKKRLGQLKQTFSDQLATLAPNLDIYIIPDKSVPKYKAANRKKGKSIISVTDVAKASLIFVAATIINLMFSNFGFKEANMITVYILSGLVTAVVTASRGLSLVYSAFTVIAFNFLFTDPKLSLEAYDAGYTVTFVIMFLSAFISGNLATVIRTQARQSAQVAYRTKVLLDTDQLLQRADGISNIVSTTSNQLKKLLEKTIVFYQADGSDLSEPSVFLADDVEDSYYTDKNERAVAQWVLKNNKHAGATTSTLGDSKCLYLAVRREADVYGVVGIAMEDRTFDVFENNLVLSILGECALALEKEISNRRREEAAAQAKNEQLRANLLRSISHDLRTPLTSISGNAGVLMNNMDMITDEKKLKLCADIYDDSMWLINLVENLLSVTRIEDGTMSINMQAELVDEVIAEALRHINRKSQEHTIRVEQVDELLMAKMDARLIVQVIINIVDNAIKYTPIGSEIVIKAIKKDGKIEISIADNGDGISDEAKERLFEMFFTGKHAVVDSRRGLGLGLALCKSIVSAHGGTISVEDNYPQGTVFTFTLSQEEVNLHE